jgi:hypothetical protein
MYIRLVNFFLAAFLTVFILSLNFAFAQTIVSGKVTDAETGEAIPMANVYFEGTTIGTSTDFEGFLTLKTAEKFDTVVVSFIGYKKKKKVIEVGKTQILNFQLETDATMMKEIVVSDKYENPAWEYLRNIVANKKQNDYDKLSAYEYESYNKLELSLTSITEKFAKKNLMSKILSVIDSAKAVAGEDGKPMIPVFVSETLSKYYFRKNPTAKHETVLKTMNKGVFIADESFLNQILGSTFQQYNFYRGNVEILRKSFISPIADSWRVFYDYELKAEGVKVGGVKCAQIEFRPKRKQDLAFEGTMWITEDDFSLKQIDVTVGKDANLNFIEKIKIQQELTRVISKNDTVWLPSKTRIILKLGQVRDDWAGMIGKSYTSMAEHVINEPKDVKFYAEPVRIAKDAKETSQEFWQSARHDTLTREEIALQNMIDTIKNLPVVRTYAEIADILIEGFKKVGPIDIGSYAYLYANNNVEGHRFRLRFRTNVDFSKKFALWGYGAYGTTDRVFKYGGGIMYLPSRKPWTEIRFMHQYDINQVALTSEAMRVGNNDLFMASVAWGNIMRNRPFMQRISEMSFQTDVFKGFQQKIGVRRQDFDPLYPFEYHINNDERGNRFTNAEIYFETRISFREQLLQNGNRRVSVEGARRPVFTFRYVKGLNNFLGGEFNYDKFGLNIEQYFPLGFLGKTSYIFSAGYTPNTLPYPLLEAHLGNQVFFYNTLAFNQMRYFEFVSDRFASLRVEHDFGGLLFNRIPLIRKLQWRLFATGAFLMGSVSNANRNIIPAFDGQGNPIPGFNGLAPNVPYSEVGYGVSNIFRFLRVHALHRLTYLDRPDIERFSIKVSVSFDI